MKKLVASAVLAAVSLAAWAQPTTKTEEVEIVIDGSKVVIESGDLAQLSELDLNGMIEEITRYSVKIQTERKALLAKVAKAETEGDISAEQAEEMREMIEERTEENVEMLAEVMESWGEAQSARMEAWEEQYEMQMEAWEEQYEAQAEQGNFNVPPLPPLPPLPPAPANDEDSTEAGSRIIISDKGIEIKEGKDGDEPFALRFNTEEENDTTENDGPSDENKKISSHEGYTDWSLGFNTMLAGGSDFINDGPQELNFFRSNEWNIGFGGKQRIGSPYSKFYFRYGGEFSFHDFKLIDENVMMPTDSNIVFREDTVNKIGSSKYKIAYFNIPIMFQLDFSEVGDMDESFTVGVGGYVGVRLNAKRLLEYETANFNHVEEKVKDDFFTQQFRYGLMAQVGFDSFKITAKYDLNNYFKEGKGPDYQMASITIGWVL